MSPFSQIFEQTAESRRLEMLKMAMREDNDADAAHVIATAKKYEDFVTGGINVAGPGEVKITIQRPDIERDLPASRPLYQIDRPSLDKLEDCLTKLVYGSPVPDELVKECRLIVAAAIDEREGERTMPIWKDEDAGTDYPAGVNNAAHPVGGNGARHDNDPLEVAAA